MSDCELGDSKLPTVPTHDPTLYGEHSDMKSLKGHFLIAAASLADPNFSRSVVLVLQHDADGALGVVVNRPLDVSAAVGLRAGVGRRVRR